jgi:hypothetical protein
LIPGSHYPGLPNPQPVIWQKNLTWDYLNSYLRTGSALYAHFRKYPEDQNNPDGDIAKQFVNSLKRGVAAQNGGKVVDEVLVEWPISVILVQKT